MGVWRTRAIRSFLVEDVAALRPAEETAVEARRALQAASRKGRGVAGFDLAALLVLIWVRSATPPVLELGRSAEALFSLGLLAIAVHCGFRLGQLEKYRAVERTLDELERRDPDA